MLKEGRRLRFLESELDPYTFQIAGESTTLIPNRIESYASDNKVLSNCLAGELHGLPLIRSGSVNSDSKVRQVLALAEKIHKDWKAGPGDSNSLRVVFDQSQSVEFEWDMIHDAHQSIIHRSEHIDFKICHLCSNADPLVTESPPPFKVKSTIDMLDQLPKIFNMEAWAQFCFWFGERLQKAFEDFPYDALDEYTLERHIQKFLHETHSPFLKRVRQHLLMQQLSMGYPEEPVATNYQSQVNQEKEVIKVRYEMQKLIRDHYISLVEIVRTIEMIEKQHPELESIQRAGIYLRELIGPEVNDEERGWTSWGRGQILKQLLCAEFNVIPAISSLKGLGRAHFSFAIRAAAMAMREKLSWHELKHLVLNWREVTVLVNRLAAKQGEKGLQDPSVTREVMRVLEFRELVFEHLKNFCTQISSWNHEDGPVKLTGNEYINPDFLNFLPAFRDHHSLVVYDYAGGEPSGLTEYGLSFYASIL